MVAAIASDYNTVHLENLNVFFIVALKIDERLWTIRGRKNVPNCRIE
jgi:hypothetical protein